MRGPALSVLLVAAGCLTPAAERTHRDEEVGVLSGVIEVDDGLAAVRASPAGTLALWAAAPGLRLHLHRPAGAGEQVDVTIDNCLADAVLTVEDGAATVTELPRERPTQTRWRVALGGADTVLTLAAPDAATPGPFRFAVVSDVQEAIDHVQDLLGRMAGDPSIRFVLSAGDLTDKGTPAELARFQKELRSLSVPFYATPGNHDIASSDSAYRDAFGRGSYRFVYRGVQVTLLDSASATIDPPVYDWLDRWLAEGRDRVHLVLMHIPPIDPVGDRNAAFASRAEAHKLLGRLADGGVDLTIYGHIHSFYAFANAGIPAYVSGGGGAHPERADGIGRHYLTVDVGPAGVTEVGVVRIDSE